MRIFNFLLPLMILLTISTITAVQEECPCDYPSVSFKGNTIDLSAAQKETLGKVASKMRSHPDCNIVINGYRSRNKIEESVCQKRMTIINTYLIEKEGISSDRIILNCSSEDGDKNHVEIKCN